MTKKPMHPNSLANLTQCWDSESAKAAQLLGAAKKRANREARDRLKLSMHEWEEYKKLVLDENNMTAVDTLKILMHRAIADEDYDTAADLAKSIAEFEQPKLQRIEQKVDEISVSDLSDEELSRKLLELSDPNKRDTIE